MARDRLWICGVSARLKAWSNGSRKGLPRKTGASEGEALPGGWQFLLEFGHVFLALRRAAGAIAAAPAEDGDYSGGAAGLRLARIPAEAQTGVSVVRKHFHRFRGAGKIGAGARHSSGGLWLERRR